MKLIEIIGRNVAMHRDALGMTQSRLAHEAGITTAVINWLERLRYKNISLDTLEKIAVALRVSVIDLLKEKKREA